MSHIISFDDLLCDDVVVAGMLIVLLLDVLTVLVNILGLVDLFAIIEVTGVLIKEEDEEKLSLFTCLTDAKYVGSVVGAGKGANESKSGSSISSIGLIVFVFHTITGSEIRALDSQATRIMTSTRFIVRF